MTIPFSFSFYDADLDDGTEYIFGFKLDNPSAIVVDDMIEQVGRMEAKYGGGALVTSDVTSGIEMDTYEVEQGDIHAVMTDWHEWFTSIGANPGAIKDISYGNFVDDADVLAALI